MAKPIKTYILCMKLEMKTESSEIKGKYCYTFHQIATCFFFGCYFLSIQFSPLHVTLDFQFYFYLSSDFVYSACRSPFLNKFCSLISWVHLTFCAFCDSFHSFYFWLFVALAIPRKHIFYNLSSVNGEYVFNNNHFSFVFFLLLFITRWFVVVVVVMLLLLLYILSVLYDVFVYSIIKSPILFFLKPIAHYFFSFWSNFQKIKKKHVTFCSLLIRQKKKIVVSYAFA